MRIVALATCLALMAQQNSATEARHRFQVARKHHELGRFEEAIAEYLLVYELKKIPDALFNVAQCYRNLDDEQRAIFFFERYLKESKRPQDRPRVEALIRELEEALAEEENAIETATVAEIAPDPEPELDLALDDAPAPMVIARPPAPVLAEAEVESPSVVETWWFWTVLGVAAAAVAGGTVAAVMLRPDTPEGTLTTIDATEK